MNRKKVLMKTHRIYSFNLKKIWMKASKMMRAKTFMKTRRSGKRPSMKLEKMMKTIIQRTNPSKRKITKPHLAKIYQPKGNITNDSILKYLS